PRLAAASTRRSRVNPRVDAGAKLHPSCCPGTGLREVRGAESVAAGGDGFGGRRELYSLLRHAGGEGAAPGFVGPAAPLVPLIEGEERNRVAGTEFLLRRGLGRLVRFSPGAGVEVSLVQDVAVGVAGVERNGLVGVRV